MVELSNDLLTVSLHPKGAEIISIKGKKDQLNYMWRRDASQWANSAPILFPIVGAIKNDTCRIDGKEYHIDFEKLRQMVMDTFYEKIK